MSAIGQPKLPVAVTLIGFVAVLLTLVLWAFARQLRGVKVQKYRRCMSMTCLPWCVALRVTLIGVA